MTETLAILATVAMGAAAARLGWLRMAGRRITVRACLGLPRRKPSALARTVDRMPERDEHETWLGGGGAA